MIISAGEALVDLLPDPRPGGGPMNTAVTCARLGAPTAFLGRVSTDRHGDQIWEHLRASGVDLRVAQRGDEPTTVAEVAGDPPRFVFHGDGTADAAITAVDLTPLGPGPHLLHGGTLGMFREPGAEAFAGTAEAHAGLVSLDPNVRPEIIGEVGRDVWERWFQRWVACTDVFRASDADLDWLQPGAPASELAAGLLTAGVGAVVVTTAAGATVHTPQGDASVASPTVRVVDTVGAGDAFVGGMLVSLFELGVATRTALDELDLAAWHDVLVFATLVASTTCTRVGADPPWRADLEV